MAEAVRRQIWRMFGEFLREAALLVLVLGPLESLITSGSLTIRAMVVIVVVAVPCLVVGIALGVER